MMTSWFVHPQVRHAAAIRCFCFPYAGVGASAFRGWAPALAPEVEVIAVQLPGRESRLREAPVTDLVSLARGAAAAMAPLVDRPYALFGHSVGAIVAFETARNLRERGLSGPVHLFVAASRAPDVPWPFPPVRQLQDLPLLEEIDCRYGGTVPREVMESAELRELFVPSLRADIHALETYQYVPASPLSCPISAFMGAADRAVDPSVVERWNAHTTGAFSLRVIGGGHLFLQSARSELLAWVRQDLTPHSLVRPDEDSPEWVLNRSGNMTSGQ